MIIICLFEFVWLWSQYDLNSMCLMAIVARFYIEEHCCSLAHYFYKGSKVSPSSINDHFDKGKCLEEVPETPFYASHWGYVSYWGTILLYINKSELMRIAIQIFMSIVVGHLRHCCKEDLCELNWRNDSVVELSYI